MRRHSLAVAREAVAIVRSQRALSIFSLLVAAGTVVLVLLTVGRTVAAQTEIVASIDQAGTRSIVLRLLPDAQVTPAVLTRIAVLDGVASVDAFGPATDVRSTAVPDGTRVAMRSVISSDLGALGLPQASGNAAGYATPRALQALGFVDGVGLVALANGSPFTVAGTASLPPHLAFLDPTVLVPGTIEQDVAVDAAGTFTTASAASTEEGVAMIVVLAERPNLVAPLARAVSSVLGAADSEAVTAETSEAFARLRGLVGDQLSGYSRGMLAGALAAGAILVAATLQASVILRRKDYGRRRALGASQRLIVALVVAQAVLVTAIGSIAGAVGAHIGMLLAHLPLPRPAFTVALIVLTIAIGAVAALVPAWLAARREPLTELRVP